MSAAMNCHKEERWRTRKEIPIEVYQQLWDAARASIAKREAP